MNVKNVEEFFRHYTSLTTQKRIHSGENPFECSKYGKNLIIFSVPFQQKRIHTGEKPLRMFRKWKESQWALRSVLHTKAFLLCNKVVWMLIYYNFEKKFVTNSNLIRHKWIGFEEKPFECSECPEKFNHPNVHPHKHIHSGEKPYERAECPKKFC